VRAADFDNDGHLDLVGTDQYLDVVVWGQNDGNQNFEIRKFKSDYNGANHVWVVDLDQDGDQDVLAVAYWGKEISWWENPVMD